MKKCVVALALALIGSTLALGFQNSDNWIKYHSAEGRYNILLPSPPSVGTQESATDDGTKFIQYKALVVTDRAVRLIGYFDYAPDTIFSVDKARDRMVSAVKGTLLGESPISVGDRFGRELKVETKLEDGAEYLMQARIYDIDRRVYIVQFIFPKSLAGPAMTKEATKYFDSFEVTKN